MKLGQHIGGARPPAAVGGVFGLVVFGVLALWEKMSDKLIALTTLVLSGKMAMLSQEKT